MAKVVVFNIPAAGHTYPTLPIVRELIARGEQVEYFSTPGFRDDIERTGAVFRCYGSAMQRSETHAPRNLCTLAGWVMADCRTIAEAHLETVRATRPDYIIRDALAVWGNLFARLLSVPAISSISTFAFNKQNVMGNPRFLFNTLAMLPGGAFSLWSYWKQSRAIARKYGVPRYSIEDCFGGQEDLNLVHTSREFQPGAESFDERYKFVGSSLETRSDDADFPWDRLDERPLVYVSLGTSLNEQPDFFGNCLEAMTSEPLQVVMSVGDKIGEAEKAALSEHCIAERHVPQLCVLKRAALFITHGGMNSVSEGLYYGVPLIVVPQTAEQALIGRRVAELGAGLVVPMRKLTCHPLRQAALTVLGDERYRHASAKIGQSLREAGGYLRAADEIFAFKKQNNIS